MAKHGPNRLADYLSIHETVMERFRRESFIEADTLDIQPLASDVLHMEGAIRCSGGLTVTVDKYLRIIESLDSPNPRVQTYRYAYNVSIAGRGSLFRYDNIHAHAGHEDPNHRHAFDPTTGAALEVRWIGPEWPTLGEVLEEAQRWCWEHLEELGKP